MYKNIGRIPFTAHGAQIPPPLISIFVYMLILGLPRRVRKMVLLGLRRVRIRRKNEQSKISGGGGICAPSPKQGIVPLSQTNMDTKINELLF